MSKFLGTLSNSLRDNISHVATAAAGVTSNGPEPVFDRMQARLHEIQTDPATFCSEPDGTYYFIIIIFIFLEIPLMLLMMCLKAYPCSEKSSH